MASKKIQDMFLINLATEARNNAVIKNTGYAVGAVVVTADGDIQTGCNIESDISGLGCCAERVALMKALSEGYRAFTTIAVVGGYVNSAIDETLIPCGVCLQFMSEYCEDIEIVHYKNAKIVSTMLSSLLPNRYSLKKEQQEDQK